MDRRSYRKRRIKRNRKIRRFRLYALIGVLITLTVFSFKFIEKNKSINEAASMEDISKEKVNDSSYVLTPSLQHKDLGEIESIIEYGTNGLIGAHYPVFDKSEIDSINKELVNEHIKAFKNELNGNSFNDKDYKYELSIDYETYSGSDNIISIVFNIVKNSSYLAHPDEQIVTKLYDLSKDKEIGLEDIMEGEYLRFISKISEKHFKNDKTYKDNIDTSQFKEGIYPSIANYSNFILKEDRIVFIFPKYHLFSGNLGMTCVEIAYTDLEEYIKPNLFKGLTKEENTDKTDIDDEKPIVDIAIPKRDIDPNKPMVALTFDDGPNKKTTIPILDTLKEYNSAGTFFILGNRVSSNGDILQRMLEEGSEIGNHSYNHKELTKISAQQVKEQMLNTQNAVIESTGIEPKLMRPTYGSYNDNLKAQVGMPLILWSIDTLDWQSRDSKKVTDHVLANVKDGDIILMHDIYDSTAEAVRLLVPELIDMGYQLVTVSELIEARGETVTSGQIYNQVYKK